MSCVPGNLPVPMLLYSIESNYSRSAQYEEVQVQCDECSSEGEKKENNFTLVHLPDK